MTMIGLTACVFISIKITANYFNSVLDQYI
jgi:hypothetical protein